MNLNTSICINFLVLLIILNPITKIEAISHDWVGVPKSRYGEQLWDKNSVQKNQNGSMRVLSKFIPISNSKITQEILYTMDINCTQKSFKDVAVRSKEFNEVQIRIRSGKIQIEIN